MITFTTHVWIALIAGRTDAVNSVEPLSAFGVGATFGDVAGFGLGTARFVWVARCTGIAYTAVGLAILAM